MSVNEAAVVVCCVTDLYSKDIIIADIIYILSRKNIFFFFT